jgi:hypothetical protein
MVPRGGSGDRLEAYPTLRCGVVTVGAGAGFFARCLMRRESITGFQPWAMLDWPAELLWLLLWQQKKSKVTAQTALCRRPWRRRE